MLLTVALLLMGYMLSLYMLQQEEIRVVRSIAQQGLTLTSLSSGVADQNQLAELGVDQIQFDETRGEFVFMDHMKERTDGTLLPQQTYDTYRMLFTQNVEKSMNAFKGTDGKSRIIDVHIKKFLVYNVVGNDVLVYEGSNGSVFLLEKRDMRMGSVRTPNGEIVTATSIYGEILFTYQDLFGRFHKDLSMKQFSSVRFLAGGE